MFGCRVYLSDRRHHSEVSFAGSGRAIQVTQTNDLGVRTRTCVLVTMSSSTQLLVQTVHFRCGRICQDPERGYLGSFECTQRRKGTP